MALSSLPKILLVLVFSLCSIVSFVFAREFSIVGYVPEDLKSAHKLIDLFESWIAKHGKIYEDIEEKLHRFEIFKENLKHIDDTNKQVSNYFLGLNEFADLSHEEFQTKYLGLKTDLTKRKEYSTREFSYQHVDVVDLPKSVDWRKKGAVTSIKNQGSCGMYNF